MKLAYTSHSYKTVDKSSPIALYVLKKGFIPVDPFLILPPPILDILELSEEERLQLDIEILGRCDEIWVFGDRTYGVRAEIEWWIKNRGDAVKYVRWEEL